MASLKNKVLIIDQDQIKKKIHRLAYQVLEDHFEETELVLVGIAEQGYVLAERIKNILTDIDPDKAYSLVKLTIEKGSSTLISELGRPLKDLENKAILLVDDVSNSGKTLTYGVGTFLNIPVKKIRTAVLIDRSHHQFPVAIDFYGLKLATTLKEHIEVKLGENGSIEEDAAWLA